jgi:cyclopropane fatty-acyl-phospholipid synthase-like methyltransferase
LPWNRLAAIIARMSPNKPFSPSCERNQAAILEILRRHFAQRRRVLEVGSGTGQHAVYFAGALPMTIWQTSDVAENLPGIRMWLDEAGLPNLPPPLQLDVNGSWPEDRFDAVFTANTLHIMAWAEVERLFASLDRVLERRATVAAYGPFNYGGRFTSDSNREFDGWLKGRSAVSGIRDFAAVDALASAIGLRLADDYAMPANNRTLVWERNTTLSTNMKGASTG